MEILVVWLMVFGLAMATMDTINHFGGNPANFLDVGAALQKKKLLKHSKSS